MANVKIDLQYTNIDEEIIKEYTSKVKDIHDELKEMAKDKKEFVGWLNLPTKHDKKEFGRIKIAAERIRKDSEVFVVIGIGGSYLGARAVIESLTSSFTNIVDKKMRKAPQVFFVGNSISPNYLNELIETIRKQRCFD